VIEILAQIDASPSQGKSGFCAGLVLRGERVIEASPIIKYMKGWTRDRVRHYCRDKGWMVTVVTRSQSNAVR
jgi:hypothetical protein